MKWMLSLCWVVVVLACCQWAQAQNDSPPSDSELAAISTRGRALAGYDAAAWHASDAVEPLKPSESEIPLYIARKADTGWVVAWGRFNEDKTKFLIVYEAQQIAGSTEYKVTKHDPPLEDTDFYFRAAEAHELAMTQFPQDANPQRPYNVSVLPTASGDWYVYCIPAQTDAGVLPFGGDIRYTISADGTKIIEKRRMHKAVLEETIDNALLGFHTDILSDAPEDSDVFYALSLKATQGDLVVTKKYVYQVNPDGSLIWLGKSEEIAKLLQEDKFKAIPDLVKSAWVTETQRLLGAAPPADPLEAFMTFLGGTCDSGTLRLKFSIFVHNTTDTRIVLYRNALQEAQARFAATPADILAGKYEKLAFIPGAIIDLSDEHLFMALGPGMFYSEEQEYPIIGLDLKGKAAVQFVFFTWPPTQDNEDTQRARWADVGFLYTGTISSDPIPIAVDPQLLQSCPAKLK